MTAMSVCVCTGRYVWGTPVVFILDNGINEDQSQEAIQDDGEQLQGDYGGVRVQPARICLPILFPYDQNSTIKATLYSFPAIKKIQSKQCTLSLQSKQHYSLSLYSKQHNQKYIILLPNNQSNNSKGLFPFSTNCVHS